MRGSLSLTAVVALLALIGLTAGMANAATQTTSSSGTWSDDINWDTAAPTGSDDAVVSDANTMSSTSATVSYTGSLTLESNARINASGGGSQNAFTGVSGITMNTGALISDNSGSNNSVPAITLLGDAGWLTPFGASDWNTNDFNAITGAYTWTTEGFNGHEFHYNAANTFAEYVSNANDRHKIKADAAGAFGTGDVTINQRGDQISPNRSAELSLNVPDTIADTATLYLTGPSGGGGFAGDGVNWVVVNHAGDETVNEFWLYGTQMPAGTYTASDSTTDWLGGSGTLTVLNGGGPLPPTISPSDFVDDVSGGPLWLDDITSVNYTLTFSKDMDGNTVTALDFGNAGDALFAIGTVVKTLTPASPDDPSEFSVEVIPSSTGALRLQINSGAVLEDLAGNLLDTTLAILDDNVITIYPGTAPSGTIITGTDGGSDSWNTASNWSGGVPTGPLDATVAVGVTAQVNNAATPTYSGTLTLDINSTLNVGGTGGSQNAFVGASSIIMHEGSTLIWNIGANLNFPAITLNGNASLVTPFGASDHQTDNFAAITGPHTLTINGFNNHTFNLNGTNTFTELVLDAIDRYNVHGKAAGAFGTGDVIVNQRGDQVNPNRSARLYFDVPDVMEDTATLYLNGPVDGGGFAGDGIDWVIINYEGDELIGGLWIYGEQMLDGTYDSSEVWLGGLGTLTVKTPITALIGDADENGVVNAADYIALKRNMGQASGAELADGDFDGDGDVDFNDLQLLQGNYGATSPGATGTIPEPATLGLLALGAVGVLRRRRAA